MDLREARMGSSIPYNEQEEKTGEQILKVLERGDLVVYTRESKDVHMTAPGMGDKPCERKI